MQISDDEFLASIDARICSCTSVGNLVWVGDALGKAVTAVNSDSRRYRRLPGEGHPLLSAIYHKNWIGSAVMQLACLGTIVILERGIRQAKKCRLIFWIRRRHSLR
jgi:hypothetical protein